MTNTVIDYDPLQEEVRRTLSAMDSATDALERLSTSIDKTQRKRVMDLLVRIRKEDLFRVQNLQDLKSLLAHCDAEVNKGKENKWVLDHVPEFGDIEEHHGSWQDIFTPKAEEIRSQLPPVRHLYKCLAEVYHIRRSEELTSELRSV